MKLSCSSCRLTPSPGHFSVAPWSTLLSLTIAKSRRDGQKGRQYGFLYFDGCRRFPFVNGSIPEEISVYQDGFISWRERGGL